MRARLVTLLLLLVPLLGVATPGASAASGEVIRDYLVDTTITADGTTRFHETIAYDFGGNARHGIIRAIPRWDELADGRRRQYDIRVDAVRVDGAVAPMRESTEGAFLMLTVGDPDRTISGAHTYEISYSIGNALTVLTDADLANAPGVRAGDVELYWDAIGDGWDVPVLRGRAVVHAPATPVLTRCYRGSSGSTETCTVRSGASTEFGPVALDAHQALTIELAMPRSGFTAIPAADIVDAPEPWGTGFLGASRFAGPLAALLGAVVVAFALRRRRAVVTVPVHDAVAFAPPEGCTPAQVAVAWKGVFDGRVLTATLLDLAARGAVTLTPVKRKRLSVERHDASVPLAVWERTLLDAVLQGGDSAEVGKYSAKLAKVVRATQKELLATANASGIRNPLAGRARLPWVVGAALAFVLTAASGIAAPHPGLFAWLLWPALALLIACSVGIVVTPKVQTETSAFFLSQVLGFRRLLDTDAAAARRELANRSGLEPAAVFATTLPFAVIYGLHGAWAGAFPDLTAPQLAAYGLAYGHTSALNDTIDVATRALASAMTNPASGGSGASGGSAGGGGGGGGGGSW